MASPPKGQFGNRLDTAAGRAKEAAMAQNAANQAAIAAMKVAQSEANFGRAESAQQAVAKAQSYSNASSQVQQAVATHAGQIDKQLNSGVTVVDNGPIVTTSSKTGGSGGSLAPSQLLPAPIFPAFIADRSKVFESVKLAPLDTIVFDESKVSVANIEDLLFEDIAAIELANISRHDLVDGQAVTYSPIKNLSSLKRRFDPNNIISSSSSLQSNFSQFAIDLNSRIGNGFYENVEKGIPKIDSETGNIFIYFDDIKTGELIEVQFVYNGTINEVDF